MAIYNLPNYNTANGFGMPLNMRRANPDPLDNSSVWSSYEAALEYAKNDPVAYVGQLVTVVTAPTEQGVNEHKVDVYKIELDAQGIGTLVKVGSSEAVEELDAEVQELIADVQAISTDISAINTKVGTLETDLGTAQNDITAASELIAQNTSAIETLNGDVEQLKKDVDAVEELAGNNKLRLDQLDTDKANFATKTDVSKAKDEAIAAAKTETESQITAVVNQYLTGEGAADTIDTLQEIVTWLNTEGAGAEKLVADVEAIKGDYLKNSDKTELNQSITDLANLVGTLPEDATSDTLVAFVKESVDALNISQYAKASDLTTLSGNVDTVIGKVNTIESTTIPGINTRLDGIDEKIVAIEAIEHHTHDNKSVLDTITDKNVEDWSTAATQKHTHSNESILNAITSDDITKWNKVTEKADNSDLTTLANRVTNTETAISTTLPESIAKKVTQTYTEVNGEQVANRLITPSEAQKLEKLILNSDGSVTTGQTVAAGDVQGLADWITTNGPTHIKNLTKSNLSDELATQIDSAIDTITVNGVALTKTNGSVDIPVASATAHGTVMLGNEFKVAESGAMEVDTLNVNKLTQTAGEYLELNGGNASGNFN